MSNREFIVEVERISKRFGAVNALSDVSFRIRKRTIHAVVGENGAGKTTLMSLLAGVDQHDAGAIRFGGNTVSLNSPLAAQALGIRVVYQELSLFPDLSVAANVFIVNETTKYGWLDEQRMASATQGLLQSIGAHINPKEKVANLSVAEQQLVEIARAISKEAAVIILDEPNSALTEEETRVLFDVLRKLKAQGATIVLVSHRLEEVLAISDEITVLRDGRHIATLPTVATTVSDVVAMMVGSTRLLERHKHGSTAPGPIALEVSGLSIDGSVSDASFVVRQGEVVGFAGLEGSGIEELFLGLFGLHRADGGTVRIDGQERRIRDAQEAIALGMAYIPANRRTEGLFLNLSVEENLSAIILEQMSRGGFVKKEELKRLTASAMQELDIRADGPRTKVVNLSGGNQQKVMLAKWLAADPRILILNDPTRGIDVGAKNEIHAIVRGLAAAGKGLLVTSSEFDEVVALSDRILVVYRGRLVGEVAGDKATKEYVTHAATTGTFVGVASEGGDDQAPATSPDRATT